VLILFARAESFSISKTMPETVPVRARPSSAAVTPPLVSLPSSSSMALASSSFEWPGCAVAVIQNC